MTTQKKEHRGDIFALTISTIGLAAAFVNLYKAAEHTEPGNAVAAGISVLAFTMILVTSFERLRK